jgi:predicted metal-dependent phosphoesterase TrpH
MHVKVLDEAVVARAKARGLDALVYAPHFRRLPEIRAAAERFTDDDLLVIPAREVFTGTWRDRRHVLAIGLTDPVPDFITFEAAMAEFARQDAAVLIPHPGLANVSVDGAAIAARADEIHAAESYNAKCLSRHNGRAREIARKAGLPGFGSSYAHLASTIGEAWTAFDRPIESPADLTALLRDRVPRRVFRRSGVLHRARALAEFGHLLYENSWGKVDRLFLSGTEPTHPGHVAYGGRYDDVRVY